MSLLGFTTTLNIDVEYIIKAIDLLGEVLGRLTFFTFSFLLVRFTNEMLGHVA